MSKKWHKRKKYVVETQSAQIRDLEFEIKDVLEEEDNENSQFQFTFTNGRKFKVNVRLKDCEYDQYLYWQQCNYWRQFKQGDKVIAVIQAQRIVNIY